MVIEHSHADEGAVLQLLQRLTRTVSMDSRTREYDLAFTPAKAPANKRLDTTK
jgi:hypothetical protein